MKVISQDTRRSNPLRDTDIHTQEDIFEWVWYVLLMIESYEMYRVERELLKVFHAMQNIEQGFDTI